MGSLALHYLWWIVALVLIGGEVLLPGYFMLWIGIGAAAMGIVVFAIPDMTVLAQAILFGVLAFVSCFAYWKFIRPRLERVAPVGNERLNRRGDQLVGQRFALCEPIVNGRGKAKVGDGMWLVVGPDLPLGATIEVVGIDGTTLRVKAVDVA
jgi:membrane protein implicated in regulation of membrane protease activity